MMNHPPGDRDVQRLIRALLSNGHAPAEASDLQGQPARQCTAFGLDFSAARICDGQALVAANDSFPPGDNAA